MQLKHLSECRISLETGFSLLASSPPLAVGARSSSTSSQITSNLLCRLMMISPWEQKSSPWLNERLRTMIINKNKNNWLQFSLQTNNKLAFANMPYTNGVGKYTYMCSNVDTHTKVENMNLKTQQNMKDGEFHQSYSVHAKYQWEKNWYNNISTVFSNACEDQSMHKVSILK